MAEIGFEGNWWNLLHTEVPEEHWINIFNPWTSGKRSRVDSKRSPGNYGSGNGNSLDSSLAPGHDLGPAWRTAERCSGAAVEHAPAEATNTTVKKVITFVKEYYLKDIAAVTQLVSALFSLARDDCEAGNWRHFKLDGFVCKREMYTYTLLLIFSGWSTFTYQHNFRVNRGFENSPNFINHLQVF